MEYLDAIVTQKTITESEEFKEFINEAKQDVSWFDAISNGLLGAIRYSYGSNVESAWKRRHACEARSLYEELVLFYE